MFDNYHYPLGADNENAPWNEKKLPEKEFTVCVSQTLSKTTDVSTSNYYENVIIEPENEVYERTVYTDGTDWKEAYSDSGHYTPSELLREFKNYLEIEIARHGNTKDAKRMKHLIEECCDWIVDDEEIIKD